MVKLRFGNLNAELEGDPKEIVSILRDLGVSNQPNQAISAPETPNPRSPNKPVISDDELIQKLPDRTVITKMIEDLGKPFSFTIAEQERRIFGIIIDTRENQRAYSRIYDLHKYARNEIEKKYGGHWKTIDEVLEGHKTTRYTWVADEVTVVPTTTTGLPDESTGLQESSEPKNTSNLFNF